MAREAFKPTPGDRRNMMNLPASAEDLPEKVVVDLDSKEPAKYEIVVTDDTPTDDQGRPNARRLTALEEEEADLRGVSDKVQKRINRLRFETQSQIREKEAALRERDTAAALARDQANEIERLRRLTEQGTTALATSMKGEQESKIADATRRLEQAHAEGNSSAIATATRDLSAAQAALQQIQLRTPVPRTQEQQREQPRQEAQPQQRQVAPTIKPNVAAWLAHNDRWFNKDPARTDFAMSIHRTLMQQGVKDDSPEYTQKLDEGLRAVYPDHEPYDNSRGDADVREEGSSAPRRTNVAERGGREDGQGNAPPANPRRVELTQSELSLAKRMRIPVEVYAAEKLRRLNNEKGGA